MAQYFVLTTTDVPALGATGGGVAVYRGDHADEATAVAAAAAALAVMVGGKLWACTAGSLTSYTVSAVASGRTVAPT
jgi:hypothetical protein